MHEPHAQDQGTGSVSQNVKLAAITDRSMRERYRQRLRTSPAMSVSAFLHEQEIKAFAKAKGLKQCRTCRALFPIATIRSNGGCESCSPSMKRKEREVTAKNRGAHYVSTAGMTNVQRVDAMRAKRVAQDPAKALSKAQDMLSREAYIAAGLLRVNGATISPTSGMTPAERFRYRYTHKPEFALKERMRRQITKARKKDAIGDLMRGALARKGSSTRVEDALGYTIADLAWHLESLFTDGMTWEAFRKGEIHIDHVMPQASFNLSDEKEWAKCWALSNLQPLWAKDNWSKGARVA